MSTDQKPRAACASHVDDWLWTEHKPSEEPIALAEAKPICGGCEVRDACLELALSDLSIYRGIWAGTSHDQRRRMVRNNARKSRAKETTT
jgi:WhiB family redox-sensing transcriptional regulator